MSKTAWLGSIATLLLGLLLLFFSREISQFITAPFVDLKNNQDGAALGEFEQVDGLVYLKPNEASREIRLNERLPLRHLDQIRIEAGSLVVVKMHSDWRIQVTENSTVIFESYRPQQPNSPVLMSIVRGDYLVLTPGTSGQLFIGRDKKIFLPQNKPEASVRKVTITPTLPAGASATLPPSTSPSAAANTDGATLAEPLPSEAPLAPATSAPLVQKKGPLPDKLPSGHEETLSSAYIETVLSQEAGNFRRCQINSVRDSRQSTGSLLISLTIDGTGIVKNTRVLQNEMQNEPLAQCVLSAVNRVRFKPFEGLPITITYPIEFK